ncbi:hypothetical protein KXR53_27240 [Inquilinus limosus]|uniref:hypothetical protein n=1 Tax=Inquilinus limosus TaxID=171674 RepID=UPI003F16944E
MFILAAARMTSLTCLRAILGWRSDRRSGPTRKSRRFETLPDSLREDVGLDFWPR